jgi:hypothetical protein
MLYDINIKNYIYSTNLFMCWTTNNNTCDNHTGISLVGYKFSWLIKTTKFNNQQDKKIHKNKITYKARIT